MVPNRSYQLDTLTLRLQRDHGTALASYLEGTTDCVLLLCRWYLFDAHPVLVHPDGVALCREELDHPQLQQYRPERNK